jgi:hypothetical protein
MPLRSYLSPVMAFALTACTWANTSVSNHYPVKISLTLMSIPDNKSYDVPLTPGGLSATGKSFFGHERGLGTEPPQA